MEWYKSPRNIINNDYIIGWFNKSIVNSLNLTLKMLMNVKTCNGAKWNLTFSSKYNILL